MIKTVKHLTFGIALMSAFSAVSAQDYKQIHKDLIVVDGHNDVIYESIFKGKDIAKRLTTGHTDLPRLKEGGVDVQVFAVWSDDKNWKKGAFKHANDQIDALEKMISGNSDQIELAKSSKDIDVILNKGKIAAVIGVEGGNMIESKIENLEKLYDRGVRYLTLTWNYNLPWVTAAAIEVKTSSDKGKGLTAHGKDIIRRMNELGMMVDLSHGGEKTFYDVIATSTKPILVSHSNAYALMPHYRNLKDEQLEALKKNGGVIGVNFYSGFLDPTYTERVKKLYRKHFGDKGNYQLSPTRQYEKLPKKLQQEANAPMSRLLEHINYLVKKVGIDHVAIGSDYDGIESPPRELEDVSKFPLFTKALLEQGYSKQDVGKIMGGNFLRLLRENEAH
ncbi:renal dipeptidase family protein [Sphingobacterium spiritivorum ATCC 33300]|uniref:Renal dipeptidase family protein n=1 Tax=Sphingobacterium spiritivorum ATCC 33300 TaxID=525372 RepID=C2G198_SPHSI|nr:dipeptidase [Sphingobacterium spiritivorum]EEI91075.1 renal dipeptidase family protein [Sphingobacterium spiritivorum ATCC 33300]QQS97703.1 dipeptidase [Sphingobacterium spiritivorum]